MYELVSVSFPFPDNLLKEKPRPGYVITRPYGSFHRVVVAYLTTQLVSASYFSQTGLIRTSVIKLHRLGTFEPRSLRVANGKIPEVLQEELRAKLSRIFELAR